MRTPMHRFQYTKLTSAQIATRLRAAEGGPTSASPFTNVLNGKSIRIVTQNGPTLAYRFGNDKRLTLSENNGGNISAAAKDAGIDRKTFHRLVTKHGIR